MYPPNEIVQLLMDIYSQMDLVIGMRGHANIIPFGVEHHLLLIKP